MTIDDDAAAETVLSAAAPAPTIGPLIASPFSFLFTDDDANRIVSWNTYTGATFAITGRRQDPDGQIRTFSFTHTPRSDRIARSEVFRPGPGYLLNLVVFVRSSAGFAGHAYVRIDVVRGSGAAMLIMGCLIGGHLRLNFSRAWPGSPVEGADEGPGVDFFLLGTDPPIGTIVSETVPQGALWELLSFNVELTTDATALARRGVLFIREFGLLRANMPQLADVLASTANAPQSWSQGYHHDQALVAGVYHTDLPRGYRMRSSFTIEVSATQFQAGDNFGQPRYVVREWFEATDTI